MSLAARFGWGFLAGVAIVLVKILGPDEEYVTSLFATPTTADITAYGFISLITVALGGISGVFCNERSPTKILVFCASFPAFISTITSQERAPVQGAPVEEAATTPAVGRATTSKLEIPAGLFDGFLVTSAHAQGISEVCKEPSFGAQVAQTTKEYITGGRATPSDVYVVVVSSVRSLEEAKRQANDYTARLGYRFSVGCKQPGNDFFPVYPGDKTSAARAMELKAKLAATGAFATEPFISNYPYRVAIYTAG